MKAVAQNAKKYDYVRSHPDTDEEFERSIGKIFMKPFRFTQF
jgi:hypothetical protein